MKLIELLWCFATLLASGSVLGMLYIYRSMEQSFRIHLRFIAEIRKDLMEIRFSLLGRDNDRVQGMAEDTKVEQ